MYTQDLAFTHITTKEGTTLRDACETLS
jgi:hypothetical protein